MLRSKQNECLNNFDRVKENHLVVDIQRQRLACNRVAVAIVLDGNEVRVVARHEGDGARGVGAEELGETPLKGGYAKKDKDSSSIVTIWGRSGSCG